MVINEGQVNIRISSLPVNSYDPGNYDLHLPPEDTFDEPLFEVLSIEVETPEKNFRIALACDTAAFYEDCAILNGSLLSVLQGWEIYHINIDECSLAGITELDTLCPNYNLYRAKDGYIVFGELEITMLDHEFHVLWAFQGNDVFCPMDNNLKPMELCEGRIKLYDFNGDYYELNYSGELIAHQKSTVSPSGEPLFEGYEIRNYKRLKPKNPALNTLEDLYHILTHCWKAETAYPSDQEYWTEDLPSYGQCAVTAMLVYDLFGGEMYRTPDHSHYYNRIEGHWVDLTAEQFWAFGDECDYDAGEKIERKYVGQSGHTKQRYEMLVKNIAAYLSDKEKR